MGKLSKCIQWKGSTDRKGYPQIRVNKQLFYVHRVLAGIYLGFKLKSKLIVCHKCDNPGCINAKHLFIGTQRDNLRDMVRKGRQKKASIITMRRAEKVRAFKARNVPDRIIAKRLGVSPGYVWNLHNRYNKGLGANTPFKWTALAKTR